MKPLYERVPVPANGAFHVFVRDDPQFAFLWHHHPELELTLITSSHGRRYVGDHVGSYEPGDLVLVGPNVPHTWCSQAETRRRRHGAVVVQFDEALLAGPLRKLRPLQQFVTRAALGLQFVGDTQREVAARLQRMPTLPALAQIGELWAVMDMLVASAEALPLSSRPFVSTQSPAGANPIDRVCQHLDEHFAERVSLSALAKLGGMSRSAFSRYFHRSTGHTLTAHITELRLARACQLLIETERGIADIAGAVGFSNMSNFNRHFLRRKGMPPRAYRAEYRRHQSEPG